VANAVARFASLPPAGARPRPAELIERLVGAAPDERLCAA